MMRRGNLAVSYGAASPARLAKTIAKWRNKNKNAEGLPLLETKRSITSTSFDSRRNRVSSFDGQGTMMPSRSSTELNTELNTKANQLGTTPPPGSGPTAPTTLRPFSRTPLTATPLATKQKRHEAAEEKAWGLYLQYFAVGVVYGGLPSTVYGFFLGYLNVEAYVYATAGTVIALPWSFKFFFGAVNDCRPIYGYRRKPYMVIGWTLSACALLFLAQLELPEPYWCVGREGYIKTREVLRADGTSYTAVATPCNPGAARAGAPYALLMMVASCGYCIADVAADGLIVTLARDEPPGEKGQTQTSVYLVRTLGNIAAVVIVGIGMNSWEYNGSFDWGLSFNTMCAIFALPAVLMVPVSWFYVHERPLPPPVSKRYEGSPSAIRTNARLGNSNYSPSFTPNLTARIVRRVSFPQYARGVWELLRSKAMLYVLLYQFFTPVIGGIFSTAAPEVKQQWAAVKNLQSAVFSLVGLILFSVGLWMVKRHFLDASWRTMMLLTTVFLNLIDMPFSFLTIFGVVRNQYFYLGEAVLSEVPAAINFVVSTFVIVEMADGGDEGLVYGLLTTTNNLGSPVAGVISNQLFGLFRPALSDSQNYIDDTPSFRRLVNRRVAFSFAISYFATFLSLFLLPFLPNQREDAQFRKTNWEKRDIYALISIFIVGAGLIYSVTCSLLTIFPATMCLKIVGGQGCDALGATAAEDFWR